MRCAVSLRRLASVFNKLMAALLLALLVALLAGWLMGVGRLIKIGNQPIDLKGQVFWNAEKPHGTSDLAFQFQVKFLFPKGDCEAPSIRDTMVVHKRTRMRG